MPTNNQKKLKTIMSMLKNLENLAKNSSKLKFTQIYNLMQNKELYLTAIKNLKTSKNHHNLSFDKLQQLEMMKEIHKMENKSNKKHNFPTKIKTLIIQEMTRMIMEPMFEPTFQKSSHGMRKTCSTKTALNRAYQTMYYAEWTMKINSIKSPACTNNHKMMKFIKSRISDVKFINLMWTLIKSNYTKEWEYNKTSLSQTPHMTIIGPLMLNIYLNEMDKFLMNLQNKSQLYLTYTRYLNDCLIGMTGKQEEMMKIKTKLKIFMTHNLMIHTQKKDLPINQMTKTMTPFMGISLYKLNSHKNPIMTKPQRVKMYAHLPTIMMTLHHSKFCNIKGKPEPKFKWYKLTHSAIIKAYNNKMQEYREYYTMVDNFQELNMTIQFILVRSCAKLLAAKMNLGTMAKVFKKYGKNCQCGEIMLNTKKTNMKIKMPPHLMSKTKTT
nr:intron-encoded protein-like ORF [Cupuladria biporosa]